MSSLQLIVALFLHFMFLICYGLPDNHKTDMSKWRLINFNADLLVVEIIQAGVISQFLGLE